MLNFNLIDLVGVERIRFFFEVVKNDKKRVVYFYDFDIGNYVYVIGYFMKLYWICLVYFLVMNYNVYKFFEIYVSFFFYLSDKLEVLSCFCFF